MPLERAADIQRHRREEALLTGGLIGFTLLAVLTLILAFYLILFSRPIGPPFGF
jgi:hypothetical protein